MAPADGICADIDGDPSDADRARAHALIAKELSPDHLSVPHPSLPPLSEVEFSDRFLQEVKRVAAGQPMQGGIDMSRYEAPDEPASDSSAEEIRQALRKAYVSSTFLSGRQTNLALLDELGKNAWLISNSQAEEILQNLEHELARIQAEVDSVNKARKAAQLHHKAELLGLEEHWKRGLGQILEIQVATDGLRQLFVERQRNAAHSIP